MPIYKKGARPLSSRELSLIERVRAGRILPVISDGALIELALGDAQALVLGYAKMVGYPMPDLENLVKIATFHKLCDQVPDYDLKSDYLNWVKNYIYRAAEAAGLDQDLLDEAAAEVDNLCVSDFASRLGYPRLGGGREDPLLVLAGLPVRIYLTTSPYTFLEEALRRVGREPVTGFCRWCETLDHIETGIPSTYQPTKSEPLVYHLHGWDRYPDSLVLTEGDHLEFLVNICRGQGNDAIDRVPALVRKALSEDLIVLGYSLSSWAFRGLYAGLIKSSCRQDERGVCNLVLVDSPHEKRYLNDYLEREARFEPYWGGVRQYTQELQRIMSEQVAAPGSQRR